MVAPGLTQPELMPGDQAPESGIYRVVHDGHRSPHPVCVIKGDVFPSCRHCRQRVRYEKWMDAEYLTHDWDLTGPDLSMAG